MESPEHCENIYEGCIADSNVGYAKASQLMKMHLYLVIILYELVKSAS